VPVVCAFVPAYKIAVARLDDPASAERPLIVADRLERGHVLAVDAGAYEFGARCGMTLVQALIIASIEPWVISTPLGGPVVPDV